MKYPKYEVKPLKNGGGWYILLTHKGGIVEQLFGFTTEAQARKWITKDSTARTLRAANPDRVFYFGAEA
jgi:hypothetical protein